MPRRLTPHEPNRSFPFDSVCPDAESLAVWAEQADGEHERGRIEAHLARCETCRAQVAHAVELRDTLDLAGPSGIWPVAGQPSPDGPSRRRWVWGVSATLASAAALLLAIEAGRDSPRAWLRGGDLSRIADLATAVGSERSVEPRLTGGFQYRPLRTPMRSGGTAASADNWKLLAAAGRIREDAERNPTVPHLRALGLAALVLGESERAVRALEDALAEDSQNPGLQCDLSAAYLMRARQLDRPEDRARALEFSERAIKGDERLLEAYFNRALALEALLFVDRARAAWDDYLARDSVSGWASEARQHLTNLPQTRDDGEPTRGSY